MRNMKKRIKGQGMTEYIIIVALIAIAAIGAFTLFGKTARNQVAAMASELGGETGKTAITEANKSGKAAVKNAKEEVNLSNYDKTATAGGKSGG
jgi:Flp pilus assembly pilin Flp